jgi:hypothetical protein
MTRASIGFALSAALLISIAAASAQDAAPPASGDSAPSADDANPDRSSGRFRFSRVRDGVLRLDSQTGQVSFCSARQLGWACQIAPSERAALDTEISRLQSQVDALSKEIADLRASTAAAPPPEIVPPSKNGELKLPNRADLDRAKAFLDDAWRRLVDMLDRWRKDLQRT